MDCFVANANASRNDDRFGLPRSLLLARNDDISAVYLVMTKKIPPPFAEGVRGWVNPRNDGLATFSLAMTRIKPTTNPQTPKFLKLPQDF